MTTSMNLFRFFKVWSQASKAWAGMALLSLCTSLGFSKPLFLILLNISESLEWEFKDCEILEYIDTVATIYELSRICRVSHSQVNTNRSLEERMDYALGTQLC